MPEFARDSRSELELEAKLLGRAREMGHQGITRMRGLNHEMFFGHILSGPQRVWFHPIRLLPPAGTGWGRATARAPAKGSLRKAI